MIGLLVSPASAQLIPEYEFDIKPQTLEKAIVSFALARDLEVIYLSSLTEGVTSKGVTGRYTLADALKLLFAETGLQAKITTDRAIVIMARSKERNRRLNAKPVLPSSNKLRPRPKKNIEAENRMVVVGKLISPYRLNATVSSTKSQRDFLATPQSVSGLPQELIQDLNPRDYSDLSLQVSSTTYLEKNAGITNELRLRGFSYPAIKVDGFSGHAYSLAPDIAFIDKLEVAKGPSSTLYGRMEPGGLVNLLLKQPDGSESSVSFIRSSEDYQRSELDWSHEPADEIFSRLIIYHQTEGSRRDYDLNDSNGLMLTLQKEMDDGATLNLQLRSEQLNAAQSFGRSPEQFQDRIQFVGLEENGLYVSSVENNLLTEVDLETRHFQLRAQDILMDDWALNIQLQHEEYQSKNRVLFPFLAEFEFNYQGQLINVNTLDDDQINDPQLLIALTEALNNADLTSDQLGFDINQLANDAQFTSSELTASKMTELFGLELEQLYGLNFSYSKPGQLIWQTHDNRGAINAGINNQLVINNSDIPVNVVERNLALFAQWILQASQSNSLFLGSRLDYFDTESKHPSHPSKKTLIEPSLRVGFIHQLNEASSLYASYSQAFTPQFNWVVEESDIAEQTVEYVSFAEPAESNQWEIGVKQLWLDRQIQASCAAFVIDKKRIISSIGQQRNQGLECDLVGQLSPNWNLLFSVSHVDSEILQSGEEELIHNQPRMSPKKSGSLWFNYRQRLPSNNKVSWGIGYSYVDERFADNENQFKFSSYNLLNVSFSFEYQNQWHFGLYLKNILDESYQQGVFNNFPFWSNAGRPRTVEASVRYQF
ncbi:TonB-dependent siderophore receptor [Aliikangiella coralliicola]|uniref:TonB-dependent receptor n=1 Tax=Aliikangiella coralliicola TaxID=2592383 RepID=A0A545U8V3_9GAMM|nr:TonB-dependent receptor [Aliikangiella coralliicola]TQV85901.1 TonB-dependent receptor [Aliikangiella coralliicola]